MCLDLLHSEPTFHCKHILNEILEIFREISGLLVSRHRFPEQIWSLASNKFVEAVFRGSSSERRMCGDHDEKDHTSGKNVDFGAYVFFP